MDVNRSHLGHAHFWMRAITRRGFLGSAALAGGAAATAGAWLPQLARADFDGV
ncbi:MAG: twin-arginine translocation signal domain-containing protein, partial [Chloroflexi bacterium]